MSRSETAARLAAKMKPKTRDDGEVFITITAHEDDPDHATLLEMTHAASNAGLGYDFCYAAVSEALDYLADSDDDADPGDLAHEFADSATDVYNSDRVKWLASAPIAHLQLCDEAAETYSHEPDTLADCIGMGQYEGYERAFAIVVAQLPEDDEPEPDEDLCEFCGAEDPDPESGLCPACAYNELRARNQAPPTDDTIPY